MNSLLLPIGFLIGLELINGVVIGVLVLARGLKNPHEALRSLVETVFLCAVVSSLWGWAFMALIDHRPVYLLVSPALGALTGLIAFLAARK